MPTSAARFDHSTALLIIDVQQAIDAPYWGRRNNPRAEAAIARVLAAWRAHGLPLFHVRHDSTEQRSAYRPGQAGNEFKECAAPIAGEAVIAKSVNSAFIGTGLEQILRRRGIAGVTIMGVITNNSVEATARNAGNLGFATTVISDACFTFDKTLLDGTVVPAEQVHALALANLHGEYAQVMSSAVVLAALA